MIPNLSVHCHVGECGEQCDGSHDEQPNGDHGGRGRGCNGDSGRFLMLLLELLCFQLLELSFQTA